MFKHSRHWTCNFIIIITTTASIRMINIHFPSCILSLALHYLFLHEEGELGGARRFLFPCFSICGNEDEPVLFWHDVLFDELQATLISLIFCCVIFFIIVWQIYFTHDFNKIRMKLLMCRFPTSFFNFTLSGIKIEFGIFEEWINAYWRRKRG